MVNVTPNTPPAFPILYTWNGETYEIASVSNLGCADTVYSTTFNGTAYNIYAVLPPAQAMQIIQLYEQQFGLGNIACNSLIQEAEYYSGATSGTTAPTQPTDFVSLYGGMALEAAFYILGFVVLVALAVKAYEWAKGGRRR